MHNFILCRIAYRRVIPFRYILSVLDNMEHWQLFSSHKHNLHYHVDRDVKDVIDIVHG